MIMIIIITEILQIFVTLKFKTDLSQIYSWSANKNIGTIQAIKSGKRGDDLENK